MRSEANAQSTASITSLQKKKKKEEEESGAAAKISLGKQMWSCTGVATGKSTDLNETDCYPVFRGKKRGGGGGDAGQESPR